MKRPCVANGDGIGKDRAIGVHLKLVAQPDHDEQDRPTDPSGNGQRAQDIDVRAAGDDVSRRIGDGGRPRYAGCHVNRLLRTAAIAASPGPSKPIIGISKADQNAGAVDQRVRGRTSTTRLPFPSKRIDPSQRVADRRRGGAVTKLTAPAPSCSIIELRLVRYSRERLGW